MNVFRIHVPVCGIIPVADWLGENEITALISFMSRVIDIGGPTGWLCYQVILYDDAHAVAFRLRWSDEDEVRFID